MTVNVEFTVPPHVYGVKVCTEGLDRASCCWLPRPTETFRAGDHARIAIYDTQRIVAIEEFTREDEIEWQRSAPRVVVADERLITLNEGAHGHE
jgi:hypothetical protein